MMLTDDVEEDTTVEEDIPTLLEGAEEDAAEDAPPLEAIMLEPIMKLEEVSTDDVDPPTDVLPADDGGGSEEDWTGPEEDPTTAELLPTVAEDPLPNDDAPDEDAPAEVATDVPVEALDPLLLVPPEVLTTLVEDVSTMLVPEPELLDDAVEADDAALEPLPAPLLPPVLTAPLLLPLSSSSVQKPCSLQPYPGPQSSSAWS